MGALYPYSFINFLLLDFLGFLVAGYIVSKLISTSLNRHVVTAIYAVQLFLLLWLGFMPMSAIELNIKPAEIKHAEIFGANADGVNYSAHRYGKIKPDVSGENIHFNLPYNDENNDFFLMKLGDKPQSFTIASINFFAKTPLGERKYSHIAGPDLRDLLSPTNAFFNTGTFNINGITNIPHDKKEPAWFTINLKKDAKQIIWRSAEKRSVLIISASWAAFLALVFLLISRFPAIISLALAYAKGETNSTTGKLAYGFLNISIILLVTSTVLLLIEFSVRYHYRNVLSTPTSISYFHLKHEKEFFEENNPQGFRGEKFNIEKSDKYRIVVMGDSFSWGQGVYPYTLRFPELLERRLREKYGDNIEVINLGIAGFNLPQYAEFQPYIINLKPDFVLYQWYINDMDVAPSNTLFVKPQLVPVKSWHDYLYTHSALYYLLERGAVQVKALFGNQTSYTDHLINTYKNLDSPGRKKAELALKKVLDTFQKNNIAYGVVLFPDVGSKTPMSAYRLGFLHQIVLDQCKKRKVPCLDLTRSYSIFDKNMQQAWANVFDSHPSQSVHRLAAEKIFLTFDPLWESTLATKANKH